MSTRTVQSAPTSRLNIDATDVRRASSGFQMRQLVLVVVIGIVLIEGDGRRLGG
jgi:hypothetical protein